MHIVFAGRICHPITGSELVPIRLLQELVRLDSQNKYTFFLGADAADSVDYKAANLRVKFYSSFWQRPVWNIIWHQFYLPFFVLVEKVDLLFVPHNRAPLIKMCLQVVLLHDLAELRVARKYGKARNLYRSFLSKVVVGEADRVVTVSESSKRDIENLLQVSGNRISVIYNGVGEEFFQSEFDPEAKRVLASRYSLKGPYILYVGALEHPNKNLDRLIRAYWTLREETAISHKLVLVGPKRWRPEVIFTEIERLDLQNEVIWLGYVPKEDLPIIYSGADLFVYVSLYEGFGLPVAEALASGIPVVASNTSSLPEVVCDAGMLVNPRSEGDIADAMKKLLTDETIRKMLREAGPQRAKNFSWSQSAMKLLNVFEKIAVERNETHD